MRSSAAREAFIAGFILTLAGRLTTSDGSCVMRRLKPMKISAKAKVARRQARVDRSIRGGVTRSCDTGAANGSGSEPGVRDEWAVWRVAT